MTPCHFLPLFLFIQKDMFFIIISLFSQEKIVTLWQIKKLCQRYLNISVLYFTSTPMSMNQFMCMFYMEAKKAFLTSSS